MEEWKKIPDFPRYAVSNRGRIRNDRTGRILAPHRNYRGWLYIVLQYYGERWTKAVHRLVAESFLTGYSPDLHVYHHNEDKTDNRVENLRTRTQLETGRLSVRLRPARQVRVVETGAVFNSSLECAKAIGGTPSGVSKVLCGKNVTHRGYHFERIDAIRQES